MILGTDTLTNAGAGIPVLLVTNSVNAESLQQPFLIVARVDPSEVISRRGDIGAGVAVAIVDTRNADRREVIVAALFLRNAGLTSIIGEFTKVPTDIVQDIHDFSVKVKAEGETVRTEALLMEDAMNLYGDITDIVSDFEKKYR
jgi:hypothetical protein